MLVTSGELALVLLLAFAMGFIAAIVTHLRGLR